MIPFEKEIQVRWSDCDANRHVRHSAYYDYGAHMRLRFFFEKGYGPAEMNQFNIGPVLFKEECSFIREISLDENIIINILRGPISDDGAKWILHHEIFSLDRTKKAHITTKGAWLDLGKRKLTVPASQIVEALLTLPPGEDYVYKKGK